MYAGGPLDIASIVSQAMFGALCDAKLFIAVNAAVAAPTPNDSSTAASTSSPQPPRPKLREPASQRFLCITSCPRVEVVAAIRALVLTPFGCAERADGLDGTRATQRARGTRPHSSS